MKIVFLDMDGVLCTQRAHESQGIHKMPNHMGFMDALDREGIGMLNRLQRRYQFFYVISSSWRKIHDRDEMETHLFLKNGLDGLFHEDWRTDGDGPLRGNEIERWLQAHPETTNYIILDDIPDMLPHQREHFVETDPDNGILMKHYWQMERIFG